MRPRRLYWKAIATHDEKNEPGYNDFIRREVRSRLKDLVADESIKIATQERDCDGGREFTATLYVLTEEEMTKFVEEIQRLTRIQMPVIL